MIQNSLMSLSSPRRSLSFVFGIAGGFSQFLAAIAVLFLPVLWYCGGSLAGGSESCWGQSYLSLGGNLLGYIFLISMLVGGLIVMFTSGTANRAQLRLIRAGMTLASLAVASIAGWGFGLFFAPGALLLLIATLLA